MIIDPQMNHILIQLLYPFFQQANILTDSQFKKGGKLIGFPSILTPFNSKSPLTGDKPKPTTKNVWPFKSHIRKQKGNVIAQMSMNVPVKSHVEFGLRTPVLGLTQYFFGEVVLTCQYHT